MRAISFDVKGIEEYIEALQKAGANIDEAVAEALLASAEPIQSDIKKWVQKHRLTGATEAGLIQPEIKKDGNNLSLTLGISGDGASWHAVFVEYGSPKNRPADPGIRTAFEANRVKALGIQKQVLREAGVPVDG